MKIEKHWSAPKLTNSGDEILLNRLPFLQEKLYIYIYIYIYIYTYMKIFSAAIHLYPWINNPQTSWSSSMVDFPCECSKSSDTMLLLRGTRTTNCIKLNLVTILIPRAFECIFILQTAWLATYTGTAKLDNLPPNNNPSNHLGILIKLQPKNIYPHIPGINLIPGTRYDTFGLT